MWRSIISQSLYQLVVNLGLLYLGPYMFGVADSGREHYTLIFNTFVFCQVFNEFNARRAYNGTPPPL